MPYSGEAVKASSCLRSWRMTTPHHREAEKRWQQFGMGRRNETRCRPGLCEDIAIHDTPPVTLLESFVGLPVQQVSVALPVPVLADVDEQDSSTATSSASPTPTQPQLVLAGEQKLRDDVFGSEF